MNLLHTQKILKRFKIETIAEKDTLKIPAHENDNYPMITKKNNKWLFGIFVRERENNPYLQVEQEFDSESEVTKFFFIYLVSTAYLNKILSQEYRADFGVDIYFDEFDVIKFREMMKSKEIPQTLFLMKKSEISQKRAILLFEEPKGQLNEAFVGENGSILKSDKIIVSKIDYFDTYKKVFKLSYFEKEIAPVLKEESIYDEFTDEDVYKFIS
jgi:hypothetical protein